MAQTLKLTKLPVEVIGYVGRALNARQSYGNWTTPPYIMQSLLILLAPALFAASIYMVLGRLITLLAAEHLSPIRVKWLTKVFVTGDVISFLAQSAGGGMLSQAKTQSKVNLGENIITGGLGVQALFFFCFIIVSGIFNVRLHRNPTQRSETIGWQSYLYILYLASSLIMIRSVFRMIEYAMGQDGILLQHEVFLYVFDAALMFLAMVLFNFYHPSTIVKSDKKRDAESHDSGLELMEERGQHIRRKVMDSKV